MTKNDLIEILISTKDKDIKSIVDTFPKEHQLIRYMISYQGRDLNFHFEARTDVRVIACNSQGLSNNRNNALKNSVGKYLIISDDDVKYDLDRILKVKSDFEKYENIDFLTYQIDTGTEEAYKKYKTGGCLHSLSSISKVSSIEIALRGDVARNFKFNSYFGLGGRKFNSGEEMVFLSDMIDANKKGRYIPRYLLGHPKESSTSRKVFDFNNFERVCYLFKKTRKNKFLLFCVYHFLKYKNKYKNNGVLIQDAIRIMKLVFIDKTTLAIEKTNEI